MATIPKKKGSAVRTIAPILPLALAMLAPSGGPAGTPGKPTKPGPNGDGAAICEDTIDDFKECHDNYPTGCTPSALYDPYLNLLKNKLMPPTIKPVKFLGEADFEQLESNTPGDLSKANHAGFQAELAKLGEGQVYGIAGYLYYAQKGGDESSNCKLTGDDDIDYHIAIGFDEKLAGQIRDGPTLTAAQKKAMKQSSVIVEPTPHYRAEFKPDWNLKMVQAIAGYQVKVTGQLLVDNEHNVPKDNCGMKGATATCWRASTWELHPLTRVQVCKKQDGCTTDADFEELEDFKPPDAAPAAKKK